MAEGLFKYGHVCPASPHLSCILEPVRDCRRGSAVKGRGRWGHSLLSLPVELLAELQWGDTMLPPVLIVGLQDLVVKLLGGCNEFKMETTSVRRREPREVGKYLRASEHGPAQTRRPTARLAAPVSAHQHPQDEVGPHGACKESGSLFMAMGSD